MTETIFAYAFDERGVDLGKVIVKREQGGFDEFCQIMNKFEAEYPTVYYVYFYIKDDSKPFIRMIKNTFGCWDTSY